MLATLDDAKFDELYVGTEKLEQLTPRSISPGSQTTGATR